MNPAARPIFSKELQSLRGCAALIVLLGHCLSIFRFEEKSPAGILNTLLNGGGAVTFFFALSGTVLALSLQRFTPTIRMYAGFCVRRLMRIVPMIVVAVVAGTIYCNWIDRHASYPFASTWFNEQYKLKVDVARFVGALVGYSARPDPPLWSIFIELVGSFLLPAFVLCCRRRWLAVIGAVVLLGVSFRDWSAIQYHWPVYLIDFYAGVTVLWWGPVLAAVMARWQRWMVNGLLLLGTGVLMVNRGFIWHYRGHGDPVTNLIELCVVAPMIAIILYSPQGFAFLRRRAMVFLGDVSYSLYLLHFPLMCLLLQWMVGIYGEGAIHAHWPLFCAFLMLSLTHLVLGIAAVTYRWIEIPCADLGKQWADRFLHARRESGRSEILPALVPDTSVNLQAGTAPS